MKRATPIPAIGPSQGADRRATRRGAPSRRIQALADLVVAWLERGRQRRALLRLDDRMLMDVGLSRADVEGESGKPFWRA